MSASGRFGWFLTVLLGTGSRYSGWLFTLALCTDLGGGRWAMTIVIGASEGGVRITSGCWDWTASGGGGVARAAIFSRNGQLGALSSCVGLLAKVDDGVGILRIAIRIIDVHTAVETAGGAIDSKLSVLDGPFFSAATRTHHDDGVLAARLYLHGQSDLVIELLRDGALGLVVAKLLGRGLWVSKAVVDGSTLVDAVDAIVVKLSASGSQLKRLCGRGGSTNGSNSGELHD